MPKVTKVPAPVRAQSGVLPYKRNKTIKVCLVKQSGGKYWGIPKGGVENGMTDKVSAMKEALEEAGLQGRIIGKNIGKFAYIKRGMTQHVKVFLMLVDVAHDVYPESEHRQRKWFTVDEARKKIDPIQAHLLDALDSADDLPASGTKLY
jgi:phosphohistidine phosphatase